MTSRPKITNCGNDNHYFNIVIKYLHQLHLNRYYIYAVRNQNVLVLLYDELVYMDTWAEHGEDLEPHVRQAEEVPAIAFNKKPVVKRNLIQLIETILASYELQEKYSTKLTPFCMITIGELVKKKPEYFRMVESTLVRNIHNNKIKAEDVPYIISIIAQLHNLLCMTRYEDIANSEPITDTCSNILKFLFSVSLRENLVKVDSETDIMLLLLCFDNIIDSCMKLLKPHKPYEIPQEKKKVAVVPVEIPKPVKTTSCCGCF